MKPTRASILSKTEEQFIVTRMSVLRKQQLKTLPDNKILHDFLTCVSPEKILVAYEDTNSKNRISWHISEGFKLELEESFFECPDKLQKAYEAVRRCFFEDFLDEDLILMIQIIPKRGKPYYLVPVDPSKNDGDLMRAEKLVPSWVIASFD